MTFQQMGTEGCYRTKDAAFSFYETHDNNSGQFSCHYRYPSMFPHTIKLFPNSRNTARIQLKKYIWPAVCANNAEVHDSIGLVISQKSCPRPIWTQFDFSDVSVITIDLYFLVDAKAKIMPLSRGQRLSMVLPVYTPLVLLGLELVL